MQPRPRLASKPTTVVQVTCGCERTVIPTSSEITHLHPRKRLPQPLAFWGTMILVCRIESLAGAPSDRQCSYSCCFSLKIKYSTPPFFPKTQNSICLFFPLVILIWWPLHHRPSSKVVRISHGLSSLIYSSKRRKKRDSEEIAKSSFASHFLPTGTANPSRDPQLKRPE